MSWRAEAWPARGDARVAVVGEGLIELTAAGPGLLKQSYGGDTLNTAIYLARCLSDSAVIDYVTALGNDVLSDELLAAWIDEGLDVRHVARIDGRLPGMYRVVLDERGERTFLYWRNHSAARDLLEGRTSAEWAAAFMRHRLVYFSGITLAILDEAARERCLQSMRLLRERGVIVVFDTNYRPALWKDAAIARAVADTALRTVDVALVSYEDERMLWGDASPEHARCRIRGLGVSEVVIKNGSAPCLLSVADVVHELALDPVPRPVDTTAAGDAFNAGYLAIRLQGGSPLAAVRQGHALASTIIRYPGAIAPRVATDAVLRSSIVECSSTSADTANPPTKQ